MICRAGHVEDPDVRGVADHEATGIVEEAAGDADADVDADDDERERDDRSRPMSSRKKASYSRMSSRRSVSRQRDSSFGERYITHRPL